MESVLERCAIPKELDVLGFSTINVVINRWTISAAIDVTRGLGVVKFSRPKKYVSASRYTN
jgi:hypothetical protein